MSSEISGATGLAGRYVTALFELAQERKQLDQTAQDLKNLGRMIRESDDLYRVIRSPMLTRAEQGKAMEGLLKKTGMGDLTQRFVGVIIQNRRLFALPSMIHAFLGMLAKYHGETTAEVTSAVKLSARQLKDIAASLQKAVGGKVVVEAGVDPRLLGGLIVKVGSRMVDSSLNTKLQQLRLAMIGVK